MTGAEVPPANFAVIRSRGEDVVVAVPDNRLDCAGMDAGTDFVACCCRIVTFGWCRGSCWRGVVTAAAAAGEVKDSELLLVSASC